MIILNNISDCKRVHPSPEDSPFKSRFNVTPRNQKMWTDGWKLYQELVNHSVEVVHFCRNDITRCTVLSKVLQA